MSRQMTLTEKILARHAGLDEVTPGQIIWVEIDFLMTHDVFGPEVVRIFEEKFGTDAIPWDKERVVIIPDHYIFTCDTYANRNIEFLTTFVQKHGLPYYYPPNSEHYSGVCHISLAEKGFNTPGSLLVGTDSHTCTSGAFGMFSTGIGNTEAAFVLGTGKLWLRVPETIQIEFDGVMPSYLMAKDLILHLIGDIGVDGATYKTLEFCGSAIECMSMEERMTLCNMAIEAGAKNGIIAADQCTIKFIGSKAKGPILLLASDIDATYSMTKHYDVADIFPTVAKPHSPDNRAMACELANVKLDRAYVGSCTGGKIGDFLAAAELLYGKQVVIDTFIVPATRQVEAQLHTVQYRDRSLYDIFVNGGCRIGPPSCAACVGGPLDTFGRTQNVEVVISTTNRNFPGRMGSAQSAVYLASPYTVMASALTGCIMDPRILMDAPTWA